MTRADRVELLPIVRELLRQRDLYGHEPNHTVVPCARGGVLELSALLGTQPFGEVRGQPLEKRGDAGFELLTIRSAVGRGGGQASGAAMLHDDVEADEIHGLLDTLAHLCIDEREQIACLAGACAKGHSRQARMRAIPAASAGGLNPNVERNGLASPVLSSSSIRS